eukprot:176625_1
MVSCDGSIWFVVLLFDDLDFHCKCAKPPVTNQNIAFVLAFAANATRANQILLQNANIYDAVTKLNISFVRGSICGANVDFFLRLAARICIYLKQILKMTYTCLK